MVICQRIEGGGKLVVPSAANALPPIWFYLQSLVCRGFSRVPVARTVARLHLPVVSLVSRLKPAPLNVSLFAAEATYLSPLRWRRLGTMAAASLALPSRRRGRLSHRIGGVAALVTMAGKPLLSRQWWYLSHQGVGAAMAPSSRRRRRFSYHDGGNASLITVAATPLSS